MPVYGYILIGVLLLSLLPLLMRIGVEYRFAESKQLTLRIGWFRRRISLEKKGSAAKQKKPSEPAKAKRKKAKPPLPKPKIGWAEVKSGVEVLLPALKKALTRTRRSVRFHPLNLHITMGGSDPAELAKHYGWAHALLWSVMPELERLLVIPDPHIRLDVNFTADRTRTKGEIGCSIRVGSIVRIALAMLVPGLRWYKALPKATAETAAAVNAEKEAGNYAASADAAVIPEKKPGEDITRGE